MGKDPWAIKCCNIGKTHYFARDSLPLAIDALAIEHSALRCYPHGVGGVEGILGLEPNLRMSFLGDAQEIEFGING